MWHPFEKETNKQIEEMYDSGSQWAELTLCLPSPMPFLLDLHDMKLVNFRTAVRYYLRRIDNSDNVQDGKSPGGLNASVLFSQGGLRHFTKFDACSVCFQYLPAPKQDLHHQMTLMTNNNIRLAKTVDHLPVFQM